MPPTPYEKEVTTLRQRLKALVGKDWTGKIDTLSLQTDKLIIDASTALRTTFDNVLKETSKVGGKLFDTSLARGVTQSKDIAEIYKEYIEQIQKIQYREYKELIEKIEKEYIEQIQKIQNGEYKELMEKYIELTEKSEELKEESEELEEESEELENIEKQIENIEKQIENIIKEIENSIKEIKNQMKGIEDFMPQNISSNAKDEVEDAPKHNSEKEVRNALRQDIINKIHEIFLIPLNVAANIVSAILRCLIAIVETAVLGILTLNAQILPEKSKQAELKQIADYKSFVQESVIDAKSYSHAILAYATKIKENASTYLETHDNPSYEEAEELLNNHPPDVFGFDGIHESFSSTEKPDEDDNQKYIPNPYSKRG